MEGGLAKFDPEIQVLVENCDKIMVTPEGEAALIQFYKFKDQLDLAEAIIKERLAEAMEKMSPNQKAVVSDHIRISRKTAYEGNRKYRLEGEYDPAFAARREAVYINPDTKKIDDYLKETGELPEGIAANDTKSQIEIKILE